VERRGLAVVLRRLGRVRVLDLGVVRALLAALPLPGLGLLLILRLVLPALARLAALLRLGQGPRLPRLLRVRSLWGLTGRLLGLGPGLQGTRSWI
jgi:hypothetical protein